MFNISFENSVYLLPLFIAMLIVIIDSIISQKVTHSNVFMSERANQIYELSFLKPFSWFINPDTNDKKVLKIEKAIQNAGYQNILNYRSYTTLQVLIILFLSTLYILVFGLMKPIIVLFGLLTNLDLNPDDSTVMDFRIGIGVIFMLLLLMPSVILMFKANKNELRFIQDLPLIQLSISLMLRARRPVGDILFELSKAKTIYQEIFETSYRIYIRDKNECFLFLIDRFKGTGFEDSVSILAAMGEYSKEESIRVLENNMDNLTQKVAQMKRSKALMVNLLSQFSLALPFGGVILLGAVPIIAYALSLIAKATSMM